MFPQNENRNEGTFACSPGTKTGTRVHSPKPPFYETALVSPNEKPPQIFFVQSFSTTLQVMDVHTWNHGRLHQKVRVPVAPVVGRNLLTTGHLGTRVMNVREIRSEKFIFMLIFLPWFTILTKWLQMKIWAFYFAPVFVVEMQMNSPGFSFAFAFAMNMLDAHNRRQQQARITKMRENPRDSLSHSLS